MKVTNNSCEGNCSRCGECCAVGLPITRKEEKVIRKYIKENNIEKEEIYNKETNTLFVRCCFFDPIKKECKIYPVRPFICQSFHCNKNMETLEKEKMLAHKKAYWNKAGEGDTLVTNMTTFDWLFYEDPEPLVRLMDSNIPPEVKGLKRFEILVQYLIRFGRSDIANLIQMGDNKEDKENE